MSPRLAMIAVAVVVPCAAALAQDGTAGRLLYCYQEKDARSLSQAVSKGDNPTLTRLADERRCGRINERVAYSVVSKDDGFWEVALSMGGAKSVIVWTRSEWVK